MKPVYMINGFLESGKTEFITYTLAQPYFRIKGKTLIIACEEGEVEYEDALLKKCNAVLEIIEEEEDFTSANLVELEKKHKPERIIIEYNGMWNFKNVRLPWHWKVEQQITTIDGSTFPMYYTNMRSLLAEMVRKLSIVLEPHSFTNILENSRQPSWLPGVFLDIGQNTIKQRTGIINSCFTQCEFTIIEYSGL